ncbi:mitochondrial import inner membrane translocase subunit Tim10 B [Lingula anatina]|uniref:Mitochondrial import inner membrane translocase subunit n=1 Tax=Lingula anatina TaxID=7574 RepID=A0A1S3IN57_LINAN|nr:mitochondrial import inner membrane translocase subunit Tim10 B [Lingula anatina]|eukprot:XP_013399632.1 mitochondrial import inner membrane translocase subunit Tim10 B [Lingula anatina]
MNAAQMQSASLDQQMRVSRDFFSIYNQMTDNCFSRCVSNFNYNQLTKDEASCIHSCCDKLVKMNHRGMAIFMDVQTKKQQAMMEQVAQMEQQQQNQNQTVLPSIGSETKQST